jgi:hypothetical protein
MLLGPGEVGGDDQRRLAGNRHTRRLDRDGGEEQNQAVLLEQVGHAGEV